MVARRQGPGFVSSGTPATVGSHHIRSIEPGTPASVGSHHTDDTVVAIAYYNLGVQNKQVTGKHWNKKGGAAQLIAKDIEAIFSAKHGIQVVLLSEFGNMYRSIDKSFRQRSVGPLDRAANNSTVSFFQALLRDLKLDDITVHALAPYVALVNSEVWEVEKCEALFGLCSKRENFAMHLLLKHKVSGVVVRAMNCHIPTRFATMQRKRDTVTKLCTVCTKVDYTNTAHPTPCWVIGGDLNVDEGTLKQWCQVFVKPHVPCVSTSAGNMSLARKSDVAISQGIDLDAIASWVGYDQDSYASDVHNMVAVIGVVKSSGSSDSAAKAQAKAASSSSAGSDLAAARIGSASGEKPVPVAEIEAASSSGDGLHLATSAQTEQEDEADWGVADDVLETLSDRADNEDSAAQDVLNIIFSCKDSRAIKSKQEVLDLMAEPIRRRRAYIHKLAVMRGVRQPTRRQYTMQQWKQWLSSRPLDKEDMDGAVREWKKDFENAEFRQQEQVAEWRQEDTRESKQRATQLINGAWKSELSKRYGRFQLALAFVKHPTATVDTLLESWSMYMRSPEYRRQRERSHLTRSSEVVNKADKLKLNVQALRRQNQRAANLHKLLEHGYIQSVPSRDQDMYQRWVTGRLAKDVNEATSLHGYGKLSTGKYLTAPRLDDFMGTF